MCYMSTVQFQSCSPFRSLWWAQLEVQRWRQLGEKHRCAFHCFLMISVDLLIRGELGLAFQSLDSTLDSPLYFSPFFFFLIWTIKKIFIEFVTILLLFHVLTFGPQGMWDLHSLTGDGIGTCCRAGWSLNHWTVGESMVFSLIERHGRVTK